MAALNGMELSGENVYRITIPSIDPNSLGFQDTVEPRPGSSQQWPFHDGLVSVGGETLGDISVRRQLDISI